MGQRKILGQKNFDEEKSEVGVFVWFQLEILIKFLTFISVAIRIAWNVWGLIDFYGQKRFFRIEVIFCVHSYHSNFSRTFEFLYFGSTEKFSPFLDTNVIFVIFRQMQEINSPLDFLWLSGTLRPHLKSYMWNIRCKP